MGTLKSLPPTALYQQCDPQQFSFESTEELEDLTGIIGQERALQAIRFGIGIRHEGYNLYVLGPNGTGKLTAAQQYLSERAATEPTPEDYCYLHNFKQPHIPRALRLPRGTAVTFRQDMQHLIDGLRSVIPSAFDSDEYHAQKQSIEDESQTRQAQALDDLKQRAEKAQIALIRTPSGFAFAPIKDGNVVSPDEFQQLSREQQEGIEKEVERLQAALQEIMRQVPEWQRAIQKRVRQLDEEVAVYAITPQFEELANKYRDLKDVIEFLEDVKADVIRRIDLFVNGDQSDISTPGPSDTSDETRASLARYQVNVLIDHSGTKGAPVIIEDQPSLSNLIGRVEHRSRMGALLTDFSLIKAGALHRANGGYLIVDARKLLMQPYAWEALKQAVRSEQIRIESLAQVGGFISTVSLEPEPVPFSAKIVLLGERQLYYMLHQFDPDFPELFKVAVDFEDHMQRTDPNNQAYARMISTLSRKEKLLHFDKAAVARVIEHSSRLAGDTMKLSTHMQSISDLLREASFWAEQEGRQLVTKENVQHALEAQVYRQSRVSERMREEILRQTVLIDTDGYITGQINGLAVYSLGEFAFGRTSRITAQVHLGKGEVVDIERQVELGGPIHSKGVMILASYLGSRYAAEQPLSLTASLVFEQSYSGVEGDSASSAELYALLSALADVPIKQCFAVTGSVNQLGRVQAIGGVNEKIEGFFDLCFARELTGEQGVLIPESNVKHLMLRQDVVQQAAAGKFHIYPVKTVDQGIELLTGIEAGKRDKQGKYPPDSINGRVMARLAAMADAQRAFSSPPQRPSKKKK